MLVLNTTSPNVSPVAPKPRPVRIVPSSSASFATGPAISSPRNDAVAHILGYGNALSEQRRLLRYVGPELRKCIGSPGSSQHLGSSANGERHGVSVAWKFPRPRGAYAAPLATAVG